MNYNKDKVDENSASGEWLASEQTNAVTDHWGNWSSIPTGHEQAMTMMLALRNHTDVARSKLTGIRKELVDKKGNNQKVYERAVSDIRTQFEDEKRQYTEECNNNIKATEDRRKMAYGIIELCEDFINKLPEKEDGAKDAAKDRMSFVKSKLDPINDAINTKIKVYKNYCNGQITEAELRCKNLLGKEKSKRINCDREAEVFFYSGYKNICDEIKSDISEGFNKSTLHDYQQKIKSARFDAVNYECPSEVPDYVMLGEIGLVLPYKSPDDMILVQAVETQVEDLGTKQSGEYVVKIPYAQRVLDGISLLMRYEPADRIYVHSLIQPLLMKLFMSFPAGKLEATMIDPLELGSSFPDISKLAEGQNSARIIDTKIWSKEKDIESAIATLRQRLENITQAYGGDQISQIKKEVIRALAITDFPVGFSDTALKDLHAIVRNSSSLGVCVFIAANEEELNKLKERDASLVAEIAQSLVDTKYSEKRLSLIGADNKPLFLQLDDMQDVIERKESIISKISNSIEHMQLRVEHFYSMYKTDIYDSNNWFGRPYEEIAIPIGIKGANTIVKMVLGRSGGSTEHHALIAGQTGAGKSTLLHTLIMSTLISYSPDEVQMYLLDFKEGVEFSAYTRYRLPSLRVVAINSEREFGLNVLKELCAELVSRTKHFTRYGVSDINAYHKLEDAPKVPRLLLIFDEVQELFRNKEERDSISSECLSCLNKLVMQGRAMGIHLILACQDFHNCSGLEAYFSQMVIRIAVKGSEDGAASILSSDNNGIRTLQNQPAGAAIYNNAGGVESANSFFQVSYISEDERLKLLEHLDAYFKKPDVAPVYDKLQTRVLLTNAEDNVYNCFNTLILRGASGMKPLGEAEDGYGLLLGQGFGKRSNFILELRKKDRDNLLIVSKDEKMALSLFELSIMSALYEELRTNSHKTRMMIYIADYSASELDDEECDFDFFGAQFSQQVKVAKVRDIEELIKNIYEMVVARSEGIASVNERIFLMFFGVNRARKLRTGRIYEEDYGSELAPIEMLQVILSNGPKVGVNSIVWGESINSVEHMLGDRYEAMFDKRIAYGLDEKAMDMLVAENEIKALHGKTAVYLDVSTDVKNTHFRPYDVPATVWVKRYAEKYKEIIREKEC